MNRCGLLALLLTLTLGAVAGPSSAVADSAGVTLVVHGGAGTIRRTDLTPARETAYRKALNEALLTGFRVLARGDSSLDAVEATLRTLEDSPLFNAGKGAVFTAAGRNELDAAIMDGFTRRAGAVAGVTTVKNPITAARAVMERTPHVLLAGPGADAFAAAIGLETVDPAYFFTERRWQQLERARREAEAAETPKEHGTVGAVALDRAGHLAAGTSTGGLTNKRHGRIGDSPLIGAGTYADGTCGVSATGEGEYFIRWVVAHDICARTVYRGSDLAAAARTVIHEVLGAVGASGGVIALDAAGHVVMEFNTEGMYRGWIGPEAEPHVAIYGD